MKIVFRPYLAVWLLLSANSVFAQRGTEKKLLRLMRDFISVYNTGDSTVYATFIKKHSKSADHQAGAVRANLDAFRFIGKVRPMEVAVIDSIHVRAYVQTFAYDSWWEFELTTDAWANMVHRTIKPGQLPRAAIKKGRLRQAVVFRDIDRYAKRLTDSGVFAGTVLIAAGDSVIYRQSFGNKELDVKNKDEQQYGMASLGKMFTGFSVLQLVQAKQLDLDVPIGRYLPGFRNRRIAEKVTIRQLLTHRAGMGDFFEHPSYLANGQQFKTPTDFLPILEGDSLSFEPGSSWRYSNTGFILLSLIIEKVSGQPFDAYVQDHVLTKAGMAHTQVGTGAGGGLTTVGDLFHFAQAITTYRLLNEANTIGWYNYTADGTWGLASIHQDYQVEQTIGHGGDFERVCSDFTMYLRSGYTVIVLSNTDPPFAHYVSDKIKQLLIRR